MKKNNVSPKVYALFEQEAEVKMDSFLGDDSYYNEDHFIDEFAGGNQLETIKDYARTLTLTLNNTTSTPGTIIVFGALVYPGFAESFQSPGLFVVCQESSHDQLRQDSIANPFSVKGWKMFISTGSTTQFSNAFFFKKRTQGGEATSGTMQPLNYFSANQQQSNMIDATDYKFDIGGEDYITTTINGNTVVTWVLTVVAKVRADQFLKNKPVVRINNKPHPSAPKPLVIQAK